MGRMEGKRPKASTEPSVGDDKGGIEGNYGQQIN